MKTKKYWIFLAILGIFVVGFWIFDQRSKFSTEPSAKHSINEGQKNASEGRKIEDLLARIEENISSLSAKYNAVSDWEDTIIPRGQFNSVYTIDLQDALISNKNRPVIFLASLLDVSRENGEYIAKFFFFHLSESSDYSEFEYGVNFVLKCNSTLAERLIALGEHGGTPSMDMTRGRSRLAHRLGGKSFFDETDFIVVAKISRVFKPLFSVKASVIEHESSTPEAYIQLDSGYTFVANGECLELVPLEDLIEK